MTGRGGVYGTGGDSSTDFQVLTGDAAAAMLGRSNFQQAAGYQYNYSMPEHNNVSESGNQVGMASKPGQEQEGSGEQAGYPVYASVNGMPIQGTNYSAGDYAALAAATVGLYILHN